MDTKIFDNISNLWGRSQIKSQKNEVNYWFKFFL